MTGGNQLEMKNKIKSFNVEPVASAFGGIAAPLALNL